SCSTSRVHAAPLVDHATHSPELLQLLNTELWPLVVGAPLFCPLHLILSHITFDARLTRPVRLLHPPARRAFTTFVRTLHSHTEVAIPTILTALVYVARAHTHLSLSPQSPYALERVWLGALIAASKYTQDSTLKDVHWALCTGVFGVGDIGRIERQFLGVLDWELGVREMDLLVLADALATQEPAPQMPRRRAGKPSEAVPALEPSTSSPASGGAGASPPTPASASFSLTAHTAPSKAPSSTPHPASHRVLYLAQSEAARRAKREAATERIQATRPPARGRVDEYAPAA
ncbi:hypothetical protein FB451DRAFT_1043375, partial [Mycena latifolia]